jgi:glycosyltransferase involved in cell wall biosynthesis
MIKFSVVIPCYHSEDFIEKAIRSVQQQSFTNYELLVMCEQDDEASIEAVRRCGVEPIIDDYGSSGAARNVGIEKAQGAYVLFLDSDDWYLHQECFSMLDQFTRLAVDILSFGFIFGIHGYAPVCGNNGAMYPNVWSRVWRKAFLDKNGIRFPNTSRDEDVVFCQKAFEAPSQHRMTDIPFIYYTYPREGSRMDEKERDSKSDKTNAV